MDNHYLDIYKTKEGHISINSSDGIFSSIATVSNEEEFIKYCEEKVNIWLNSEWGKFDNWSKKDREDVANKWLSAKKLKLGKYNYYFNLGNIQDIFRDEVASLAKSMGIKNYSLEVYTECNK